MAIGIGNMKYANQYALSVNDAWKVFNSQVFINCLIIVGNRLLLIAHKKKRQKINAKGIL